MHTAIRATSLTLAGLLEDRLTADPILRNLFDSVFGGTMVVSLDTPEEMNRRHEEGLSIWLYRVVRDEQRLNDLPVRIDRDHLQPPPLPLRLHYLVTPLTEHATGATTENEQLILGRVLQCLHTRPQLRGADLRSDFEGTTTSLQVRLEALSLEEITRVWQALDASYQLSVSYEVSVVDIASELLPEGESLVSIALPEYGQASLRSAS